MSYRSYGSSYSPSYSSSLRRPYTSSFSSSLYSSTFSPLYSPSTYSRSTYSPAVSTYRRPSYGSSGASSYKGSRADSLEDLSTKRYSSGTGRSIAQTEPDSPPPLSKTSFSRSLGNLSSFCDDDDSNFSSQGSRGSDSVGCNYKKLYEEEMLQRESDEAALVAELQGQIELRQKLINLLNEIDGLEDDLDNTSEMCELLKRLETCKDENKRLQKQKSSMPQPRSSAGRRF